MNRGAGEQANRQTGKQANAGEQVVRITGIWEHHADGAFPAKGLISSPRVSPVCVRAVAPMLARADDQGAHAHLDHSGKDLTQPVSRHGPNKPVRGQTSDIEPHVRPGYVATAPSVRRWGSPHQTCDADIENFDGSDSSHDESTDMPSTSVALSTGLLPGTSSVLSVVQSIGMSVPSGSSSTGILPDSSSSSTGILPNTSSSCVLMLYGNHDSAISPRDAIDENEVSDGDDNFASAVSRIAPGDAIDDIEVSDDDSFASAISPRDAIDECEVSDDSKPHEDIKQATSDDAMTYNAESSRVLMLCGNNDDSRETSDACKTTGDYDTTKHQRIPNDVASGRRMPFFRCTSRASCDDTHVSDHCLVPSPTMRPVCPKQCSAPSGGVSDTAHTDMLHTAIRSSGIPAR